MLDGPLRRALPPHCMDKSAEVIDDKGVAMAPLRKRVRNAMKIKVLGEVHSFLKSFQRADGKDAWPLRGGFSGRTTPKIKLHVTPDLSFCQVQNAYF